MSGIATPTYTHNPLDCDWDLSIRVQEQNTEVRQKFGGAKIDGISAKVQPAGTKVFQTSDRPTPMRPVLEVLSQKEFFQMTSKLLFVDNGIFYKYEDKDTPTPYVPWEAVVLTSSVTGHPSGLCAEGLLVERFFQKEGRIIKMLAEPYFSPTDRLLHHILTLPHAHII